MAGAVQLFRQKWNKCTATVESMATKAKAYGRRGKENIAIQFDRLQISSPNRYHPLADVDGNEQRRLQPPSPPKKAKKNRRHRKSLTYSSGNEIDRAKIDKKTKDYLRPLLDLVVVTSSVLAISDWARVWSTHCNFLKIAQGTYGAVFRIESKAQPGTFTIGKLIPLKARVGWGSRTTDFTTVDAAANEVSFLSKLDQLPGFVQFRKAEVLYGRLPVALELASADFDAAQEEGDIPGRWILACSNSMQLWLFLEMSDAGTDLETVLAQNIPHGPYQVTHDGKTYLSAVQIRDIFWQVASALALAEKGFSFEHRDLHLGNICLTRPGNPVQDGGLELWTNKPAVLVTIIDYTLSRGTVGPHEVDFPYCNDLSKDPVLFEGTGAQQYDIYRQMRSYLQDEWIKYEPITNVLWLTHLLVLLMRRVPKTHRPLEHMHLWNDLVGLKNCLEVNDTERKFGSAQDVVRYCEAGKSKRKGGEKHHGA
ncbi:MAG: hypothetical protein Q9225_006007 [Loekoesia sp. 1 TL-2023]